MKKITNYMILDPTVKYIIDLAYEEFEIDFVDITKKSRKQEYALPRQIQMYLILKNTEFGPSEVSGFFNRDHSTCKHAFKTIGAQRETDKRIKGIIERIESNLNPFLKRRNGSKFDIFTKILSLTQVNQKNKKLWLEKYLLANE